MRFSRAKPTGSFRVYQTRSRRVAAHADTLAEARKDAAYWTKAASGTFEIQERFPSGQWVTVETTGRGTSAHATKEGSSGDLTAASGTLTAAQRAYIEAVEQDVHSTPDAFKAHVRANPGEWALRHIEDDVDVRQMTREQRAETKLVARLTGRTAHASKTSKKVYGRSHATVQEEAPAPDAWDVAMDALLERDPARAARIVKEHGLAGMTPAFSKALGKVPKSVRGAFEKAAGLTKTPEPSAKAVAFFRKHAGYAYHPGRETPAQGKTRNAQALARAEMEAETRNWTVDWEEDPEEWQGDDERPSEVLTALLRDADGRVLASLGSIGMTGNRKADADFGRVIEAELAVEALGRPMLTSDG